MKLAKGDRIKLLSVNPEFFAGCDWINEREPQFGDEAIVESITDTNTGLIFRLLCEPRSGFLIWRFDFFEGGFKCEKLN